MLNEISIDTLTTFKTNIQSTYSTDQKTIFVEQKTKIPLHDS